MICSWCGNEGASIQSGKKCFHGQCAVKYNEAKNGTVVNKNDLDEEEAAWRKLRREHPEVVKALDLDEYFDVDGPTYTARFFSNLSEALHRPWVFIDLDDTDEPGILTGATFEDIAKHVGLDVEGIGEGAMLFHYGKVMNWTTKTIFVLDTQDVPF